MPSNSNFKVDEQMSNRIYPPNPQQKSPQDNSDTAQEGRDQNAVELTEDDFAVADAISDAADGAPGQGDDQAKQIAELNDRFLRLAAELENTRRRAEREKADAGRYAIANFARDLLGVTDNFERALHAAGNEDDAVSSKEVLSGIVAGLRMTEKELLSVLERHGVRRIYPQGEKFDPNRHQAVAQIPGGTVPAGHVVDVAQPGFMIGDRVLRAAMVTVSSGVSDEPAENTGAHIDTRA